jgi:hypothetical protein
VAPIRTHDSSVVHRYLADAMVERAESDIEVEVSEAIDRIVDRDAIGEALVEQFRDRYTFDGDLGAHLRRSLERNPRGSWRTVLIAMVSQTGRNLRDEIEASVREEIETRLHLEE